MALQNAPFYVELLRLMKDKKKINEVKSTIERENLYNAASSTKNTPLHMAAQTKNAELAKYLIDSGSTIDAQNDAGQTPLMVGIASKCEVIVETLVEAGADIHLPDNSGKNALSMIGKSDFRVTEKTFGLLLQNLRSDCLNNNQEIVEKLIDGDWLLPMVVQLRDASLTRIALQRGYASRIDELDVYAEASSLHFAAVAVDVENVKVLLEYNPDMNIKDSSDRTPLCYVYDEDSDRPDERLEILKMLLPRGALFGCGEDDIDAYDLFKFANTEAVKLLFKYDIDKQPDFERVTALHALAENEHSGAIQQILGRGFDVNERNVDERTALMMAVRHGNAETVEFLLNEGADIDAMDFRSFSAIFYAINRNPKAKQIVQLLLERGADVQVESEPLQRDLEHQDIATILDLIVKTKHFSLGELVVAHLALQESVGKSITETIRRQIDSCERFKTCYESSKQQLPVEIHESLTVLDLLTNTTDEKFEMYARNEDVVSKIEEVVGALTNIHYFHTTLQRRLSKACEIVALKRGAAQIICKIMKTIYENFPYVAENIITYLKNEDMKNLIDASLY